MRIMPNSKHDTVKNINEITFPYLMYTGKCQRDHIRLILITNSSHESPLSLLNKKPRQHNSSPNPTKTKNNIAYNKKPINRLKLCPQSQIPFLGISITENLKKYSIVRHNTIAIKNRSIEFITNLKLNHFKDKSFILFFLLNIINKRDAKKGPNAANCPIGSK